MGYIIDCDLPARAVRRPKRAVQPPSIAEFTPLVPRAVAEAVHEEASLWLRTALPAAWIPALARKADLIAARNPRFCRRLQRSGNAGRDWLWAFMRHWLAALVREHRPHWYQRLPSRYAVGA